MRYYKHGSDGYIFLIGVGNGGTEISEEEYNAIANVVKNKPIPTETTDYMLTESLEWVACAIPQGEPEADAEEVVDILTGVV